MTPLNEKMRLLGQLLAQAGEVVDDIGQSMGGVKSPHQTTDLLFDGKRDKTWRQNLVDWPRLNSNRVARVSEAVSKLASDGLRRPVRGFRRLRGPGFLGRDNPKK